MMKKINKKVEDYEKALDAYLFYDKKQLEEAGMYQMGVDDNKKETAKKMLEDNINLDLIMKYTSLTQDEMEKIKEEK